MLQWLKHSLTIGNYEITQPRTENIRYLPNATLTTAPATIQPINPPAFQSSALPSVNRPESVTRVLLHARLPATPTDHPRLSGQTKARGAPAWHGRPVAGVRRGCSGAPARSAHYTQRTSRVARGWGAARFLPPSPADARDAAPPETCGPTGSRSSGTPTPRPRAGHGAGAGPARGPAPLPLSRASPREAALPPRAGTGASAW